MKAILTKRNNIGSSLEKSQGMLTMKVATELKIHTLIDYTFGSVYLECMESDFEPYEVAEMKLVFGEHVFDTSGKMSMHVYFTEEQLETLAKTGLPIGTELRVYGSFIREIYTRKNGYMITEFKCHVEHFEMVSVPKKEKCAYTLTV